MKRFAVFAHGYNPRIPVCYVFARELAEAWEQAKATLDDRVFVSNVIEVEAT